MWLEKGKKGKASNYKHLLGQGASLRCWHWLFSSKFLLQTPFPRNPSLNCWPWGHTDPTKSKNGVVKGSNPTKTPFLHHPPGGAMNTTIHSSQGQNKTKPPLEKQLLQPLFNPQAFGVFIQKSQNFPLQEAPGRKLVPWSSATPQIRENKGNAGIYSPEWLQHPK